MLSSLARFRFVPALDFGFAAPFPFPLPPGVGVALEPLALADPEVFMLALRPPTGVLGSSMFIEVFMPCRTLRRISS